MNRKNKSGLKNKPSICLNMIVKNESHIIAETLESIRKYIDYWVISDTGSTDGTQDLIKDFFAKHKIKGELVEHTWKDFAHNRTKAFEAAFNKTDYVWIIDADDLVMGDVQFPKKMKADYYMLKYRNSGDVFTYERYQIFNNRLRWCYVGVLHEFPECLDKEYPKKDSMNNTIPGNYFIQSRRLGARSKDSDKYVKDARILSSALTEIMAQKDSREKLDKALGIKTPVKDRSDILIPRYCFYAAQSYRDCRDYENSVKYYRLRTTLGGYVEEIYYAWVQIGNILQMIDSSSPDEIISAYNKAYACLTTRSESYYHLGMYYWHRGDLDRAYFSLKIISTKSFPHSHTFFIDQSIHTWKGKYKFAKVCVKLNKRSEAKDILDTLLENKSYRAQTNIKKLYNECAYPNFSDLKILYDLCRNESLDNISDPLVQYNKPKVQSITNHIKNQTNKEKFLVTLTITTCKRLDLFKKTMNSFINCCEDILSINRFICVDDNSSESDRSEMQLLYPFFEFIFKGPDQKGHIASMNIIIGKVKTPYILHMEDDFLFIDIDSYITPALQILTQKKLTILDDVPSDQNIHTKELAQVLFTRNYQEELDRYIPGGYGATTSNPKIKYIIHEHYEPGTPDFIRVAQSYGSSNVYWPHFSFRPSILKTSVYAKLGPFDNKNGFFERAYANKYYQNNYVSTFFDKITCLHIGKLTRESNSDRKNAYNMNEEEQFTNQIIPTTNPVQVFETYDFHPNKDSFGSDLGHFPNKSISELKEIADRTPECTGFNTWGYMKRTICDVDKFIRLKNQFNNPDGLYVKKKMENKELRTKNNLSYKILCINLLRRSDRKIKMTEMFDQNKIVGYEFFEAVDGSQLKPTEFIRNLFLGNDFNYRKGFVGCALSHYNIWKKLSEDKVNDFYLIFEDDINYFDEEYVEKLEQVFSQLNPIRHDIVYLGYTMLSSDRQKLADTYNKSDRSVRMEYLKKKIYLGGFFNYIITRAGAKKLLSYIDVHHIKHGIDYVAKLVPDLLMYEIQPQLAFSEWVQSTSSVVDSDIQKNYDCLKWDPADIPSVKTSSSKYVEENITQNKFQYHPGVDSTGSDIRFVGKKSVSELMALCEEDSGCVGFNTLGFLKHKIGELKVSPYFGKEDGLYCYTERLSGGSDSDSNSNSNSMFKFHPGLDSHGYDLEFVGKKSVKDLMGLAERNFRCVGFNTLGFLKYYVGALKPSGYFNPNSDGLYVHVARHESQVKKTRIKMLCNWATSKQLCAEVGHMTQGNLEWNNLQFTWEDTDIDYWVILNKPLPDENIRSLDLSRTIVIQLEPWCSDPNQHWGVKTWGEWAEPSEEKFCHVRTHKTHLNTAFWQLSATHTDFKTKSITKTKNAVSSICSSKYFDPGHIKRIDFMKYVENKADDVVRIDIYNHDNQHNFKNYMGPHPSNYKDYGITPYKYYFMAENNQEKNFITEKIWEPLLTETLCFYWGCPNILDWVDPLAFVLLDLDDFEKSFQIMKSAILQDLWSERLPIIRKEKQKVLDHYAMMPTIERIIAEAPVPFLTKNIYRENFGSGVYTNQTVCFIHSCNLGDTQILESLIVHLTDSGLINILDHVWIINIGQPITLLFDPKIYLIQYSTDTTTFELQTINLMYRFSERNPNTKVLYLHTKGVSYTQGSSPNITDWRNLMLYFLVDKYDQLQILDHLSNQTDAIGVNLLSKPHLHFSGNFWWSTTNHMRRLGPITSGVRHDAEWWILSKKDTAWAELHNSGINHYENPYPLELFTNINN